MKAIVVEDEFLARQELEYYIQTYSNIEITGSFEDGLDVLRYVQDHEIDAIFLDINIPSLDGVLLAHNISKFSRKPYIIFITAYKEHAAEAFEIEAFDYILKPYSESRITSMLHKLEATYARDYMQADPGTASASSSASIPATALPQDGNDSVGSSRAFVRPSAGTATPALQGKLSLWKNDNIHVISVDDVYYASASEKITEVFTRRDRYTVHASISDFQALLPDDYFFRCHRSYVVNMSKIREIVPWFNSTYLLRLHDLNDEVPVSRSKVKEFRQLMHI
ncbi:LytR/AlgR family response regulator transcription factor [Paenibacillus hunanensis]|uniref:Two-component system LytT family response regulator n=1 Tax=Paenibacillus hunanensis TaxID=539262 RepID=A0ABU1J4R8_9BACL|nr:LytTR family DNA-binding domain-containing protein [Paenibacillus hunanensis]MDR6245562.1 two-component system LytT family response regulator [Paenibacillus hunanensis]GGJ09472.1 DNA-binding response regulator [Paenibacillus hunanensis]